MSDGRPINRYTCSSCHRQVVTRDMEEGVTPFLIVCPDCGKWMQSCMYTCPQSLLHEAEWWRHMPEHYTKEEVRLSKPHAKRGGLFLHYLDGHEAKPKSAKGTAPAPHFTHLSRKFRKMLMR